MHRVNAKQLFRMFHPRSVAVVGASRDPKKIGHIVLRNILEGGFEGEVYPVNPEADTILDITAYPSYAMLPVVPDLALISLPAGIVLPVIEEIAKKGTKFLVLFTAGFKEAGHEGEALEQKLAALADVYELTILGPNCLGFYHAASKLNATFAEVNNRAGNIRFLSQSGAMVSSLLDMARAAELGMAEVVTLGNKTVLHEADVLSYWANVPSEIKVPKNMSPHEPVGIYLESITDGRAFIETAKAIAKKQPVILIKPGKTEAAKAAMLSHTGAMAGEDTILAAALNEAGIIRAEGVEDMFDLLQAFSFEDVPRGPNVAVISNAGGPAVIASDALEQYGLTMAPLKEKTIERLEEVLPRAAAIHNPVDVLGDATSVRYREALTIVAKESTVDALLVILTPQIMTDIAQVAEVVGEVGEKFGKPIFCAFMGGYRVAQGEHVLHRHGIPSFRYPERAVKALGAMWWWAKQTELKKSGLAGSASGVKKALRRFSEMEDILRREERAVLTPYEGGMIFRELGVEVPNSRMVHTFEEAVFFAKQCEYKVVLKISSIKNLHKTDIHGVVTDIPNEVQLEAAWHMLTDLIRRLQSEGDKSASILIEEKIEGGVEVFVGAKRDREFGPIVVVGRGGIYTEIMKPHTMFLAPVMRSTVAEALLSTPLETLLRGYRGAPPKARKLFYEVVEKISEFVAQNPRIKELDINPMIVTEQRVIALDIKMILHSEERGL